MDWSALKFESGVQDDAITMLLDRIEIVPAFAPYYYRVSGYLYKAGLLKEGLTFFEHAVQLNFNEHQGFFDYFPGLLQGYFSAFAHATTTLSVSSCI